MMKTYAAKPAEVEKKWVVIDAQDVVLGRLAAYIATRLRGKHRPDYTPHVDSGDHVVVVNAEKLALTGRKRTQKTYYWHTGYPGGIRSRTADKILDGRHPERVLKQAVRRMMPKESSLARQQLSCLRVYAGGEHPHEAQKPEPLLMKELNRKNIVKDGHHVG